MRSSVPILAIFVLAIAAALGAHAAIEAFATFGLGAHTYASHQHAAVGPIAFAEAAMFVCLVIAGVRDAFRKPQAAYARTERLSFAVCSVSVAVVAAAVLFGMEYFEGGAIAFGLGWIGDAVLPGVPILVAAIALAIGSLFAIANGGHDLFERLVKLLFSIFAAMLAPLGQGPAGLTRRRQRTFARLEPCALHAGLRAPPVLTH